MKHLRKVSKTMPARAAWWTWFIPVIGDVPSALGGVLGKFEILDPRG